MVTRALVQCEAIAKVGVVTLEAAVALQAARNGNKVSGPGPREEALWRNVIRRNSRPVKTVDAEFCHISICFDIHSDA